MAYFHSLQFVGTLKPQVSKSQIVQALSPISEELQITPEELLNGFEDDYCSLEWEDNPHLSTSTFHLMTQGDVDSNFSEIVEKAADNLLNLIEPSSFTLIDTDIANPDDAVTAIWVGQGPDLEMAQREDAINKCMSLLCDTLDNDERLLIADQIRQAPLPSDRVAPAARLAPKL
ncbi:hypothetical protein CJP73_08330 [Neopusillimonas maritima]|uniref:Uncharacterized protein n=2 Tax=Neopusillimonas maritima TaxID=2026239 RepID=A0A3A1YSE6_9BURK|nr:hypothetical protein CJP73_08330 [Neopusillimonas maritima]